MTEIEQTIAAYNSAMQHPYRVTLIDANWVVQKVVGFQSEREARAFARSRPEPVVYLDGRRIGDHFTQCLGFRITVPHPDPREGYGVIMRDDFPPIDPRTGWPIDHEEGE